MVVYIAFLRAINVGGHTVTMARLREIFETAGCSAVETFIASGNVIFQTRSARADRLERIIEKALHGALGYEVATFLRTPLEVASIATQEPFDRSELVMDGHTLFVSMMANPPSAEATGKLMSMASAMDDFAVVGREMYWLRRSPDSRFSGARFERLLGQKATARNINTVRTIAAKLSER